jgi:hypothetical protein
LISIKEVHFYNNLAKRGLVEPMLCPFNEDGVGNHIVLPNIDKNDELFFNCLTCNTNFKLGLNTEEIIQKTIKKYNSSLI